MFDQRVSIKIDGLADHLLSTTPCSSEGVPSSVQYLVSDGRLITPSLSLRYAKKTGMPPTTYGTTTLEVKNTPSFKQILSHMQTGLIIYGVLGLNAQSFQEGKYNLTVANGLYVVDTKIAGRVDQPIVSGDLFAALNDKKTKYAKYDKDKIALVTKASVF